MAHLTIDLDGICRICSKRGIEERTGLCLECLAEVIPVRPVGNLDYKHYETTTDGKVKRLT